MAQKNLKCPKCERTFAMPAHLGRHLKAFHGRGGAKRARKTTSAGPRGMRARKAIRAGRPPAALSGMTLEQLSNLVNQARAEARRRIALLERAMK